MLCLRWRCRYPLKSLHLGSEASERPIKHTTPPSAPNACHDACALHLYTAHGIAEGCGPEPMSMRIMLRSLPACRRVKTVCISSAMNKARKATDANCRSCRMLGIQGTEGGGHDERSTSTCWPRRALHPPSLQDATRDVSTGCVGRRQAPQRRAQRRTRYKERPAT